MHKPDGAEEEWTPTDRDLQMYRDWSSGIAIPDLVKRFKVTSPAVHDRLAKTSAWFRVFYMDDIAELRTQHTSLLMQQYRELQVLWDAARIAMPGKGRSRGSTKKPAGTKAGDPVRLDRPIQIVKEMRQTLESIGALLGARTPQSIGADGGEDRVAGMPRSGVILREITKLTVQLERERQLEGVISTGDEVSIVPTEAR